MAYYNDAMRKLIWVPGIILAILFIVFALAGMPFVLGMVKEKIETVVKESTGMSLAIGRLQGNLFYTAQAEHIDVENAIHIKRLMVRYNPFRLLARQVDITSVEISGLDIDFDRLEALLKRFPKKPKGGKVETPTFDINIREFSIKNSGFIRSIGENALHISVVTRGSLTRDQIELDSLCLMTETSRIAISGSIPLNEEHDIALGYDLKMAAGELGISDLGGDILGEGRVRGRFSAIALQGILQLAVRYRGNDLNGRVALDWLVPDYRNLSVEARLRAMTLPLRKEADRSDSWDVSLDIKNTNLDCDVSSNLGDLHVLGVLKGNLAEPYFKGRLEGRFSYADFEPAFSGQIRFEKKILELSDFKLLSEKVGVDLSLLLNAETEKILKAEIDLACSDLSVVNEFVSSPLNITGELLCKLVGSGSLDDPEVSARVSISDAVIYGEEIPSANIDLSISDDVVRLDSALIESNRGRIALTGSFDVRTLDYTGILRSDGLVFQAPEVFGTTTLLLSGTVGLDLRGSGNVHTPQCTGEIFVSDFAYDTMQFGDYQLRVELDDDSLQLSLRSKAQDLIFDGGAVLNGDFPFAALLDLQHFKFDRFFTPATGYVTARVSGDGELAHLTEAVCTAQIDTAWLLLEEKRIQNIGAMIVQLQDRAISVRSCELAVAGQRVSLQGRIPLDFESSAMDFSVSSALVQLSDISYLLPMAPAISGDLRLDLRVQGKPRALDINGQLALTHGRYETSGLRIDSVNSLLGFKHGVITIERFSGRINSGQFEINGFADLSHGLLDTCSIVIAVDRFDYADKNFGNLLCNADLRISTRRDSLRIGGEVLIDDAVYDKPLSLQTIVGLLTKVNRPAPQQSEFSRRTYCDIGILVPDSVRIANNVANVSMKVDLQLKGYLARLNAYGTIAAIGEGSIQYLGRKFTITSAVIQFDDPYKIDPVIDLMATSTIAARDGDYEIYMLLKGTATTWQMELSSNPSLPEQDIVSLLLIGQRRPGATGGMVKEVDLKGKVKDYALDMIRHNIEKTTGKILGLDEFTITGDLSDPTTMRIGIEKSIIKGFRIHYSTGVESWELLQIGASYDLTKRISVFTLYDQENRNTSVDLEYHIKIK